MHARHVLLADADLPYDQLEEMDGINGENPLIFGDKTSMRFGDATSSVADIVNELQEL